MRVDKACADAKQVGADRARDRVISMYNERIEAEIDEQREGLILAELFPKPRPVWVSINHEFFIYLKQGILY